MTKKEFLLRGIRNICIAPVAIFWVLGVIYSIIEENGFNDYINTFIIPYSIMWIIITSLNAFITIYLLKLDRIKMLNQCNTPDNIPKKIKRQRKIFVFIQNLCIIPFISILWIAVMSMKGIDIFFSMSYGIDAFILTLFLCVFLLYYVWIACAVVFVVMTVIIHFIDKKIKTSYNNKKESEILYENFKNSF